MTPEQQKLADKQKIRFIQNLSQHDDKKLLAVLVVLFFVACVVVALTLIQHQNLL